MAVVDRGKILQSVGLALKDVDRTAVAYRRLPKAKQTEGIKKLLDGNPSLRLWTSCKALEDKCEEYFATCYSPTKQWDEAEKRYKEISQKCMLATPPGLAFHLGLPSVRCLNDLRLLGPEHAFIVDRALLRIEKELTSDMCTRKTTPIGMIFASKNWCGYSDDKISNNISINFQSNF